jgi:hypothetical protein
VNSAEIARALMREHAVIVGPDEVLVVQVPPVWTPREVRELNDALAAYGWELGMRVLAVPGTGMAAVTVPADPFAGG